MSAVQRALILILEDEAAIGLELEARLRRAGYDVLGPFPTAASALAAAERRRPDLALTDVRIVGDRDGIVAAGELRARFEVPSVFLTAHADDATLRRTIAAEPFGYLTKPFRESELLATVQLALQRVRLERELRLRDQQLAEAHRVGRLGTWNWDVATDEAVFSYEVVQILGVASDDFRHDALAQGLELVHPDDRAAFRAFIRGRLEGDDDSRFSFSVRIVRPDGGVRHVQAWAEIQRDPQRQPVRVVGIAQDVTEEAATQAAIVASEQRFVTLFESSPDALVVVDDQGRVRLANDAATTLFGYPLEELVGLQLEVLVPAGLRERHRTHRTAFTTHERRRVTRGPIPAVAKGARELLVEVGLSPTTLDGQPMVMAAVRDVSLRVEAERALATSEARFRALFEQAGVGIAEVDAAGTILRANRRLAEIFGYEESDLVGRELVELIHPDELTYCRGFLHDLVANKARRVELESRGLHSDGSVVWCTSSAAALWPAGQQATTIALIVQDITARRRAEQQRREAEASLARVSTDLQAMLAAVPDSLFRVDADGRVLDFQSGRNPPRGLPPRVIGAKTRDLFPGEVAARMQRAVHDAVARRMTVSLDYQIGAEAFEGRVAPAGDGEALMIVRNITEQRASERALREAEARLHQAQKLDAIGRLAGGIAHDFNNMLSIVLGTAPLLAPLVEGEGHELLQEIVDASHRASLLTNRLLAFARNRPAEPRVIAIDPLIESFSRLLQRALREDIELVLDLGAAGRTVRIDPSQLEQVLLNLAVNARDAMQGGGTLTITSATVRGRSLEQPSLHIEVRDTGSGMSPETLARLFEPFFTTKEVGEGTGLGLATVYGIVRQAGGSVHARSTEGTGSTFDVFLPLSTEPADQPEQAEIASAHARGERLLVVEDDDAVRSVTARVLRRAGYEVVEARDGIEALAVTRSGERLDLIVSDVIMPRMGGRALAHALRAEPGAPPLLFVSGHADGSLAELGPEVDKPFLPETLLRAVRRVIDEGK